MNTIKNLLTLVALAVLTFNCKNEANPEVKTIEVATNSEAKTTLDPNATYAKAEFTIEGMTCAMGCAKTIENKIAKMEGIKSSVVDFEKQLAFVEYDEAKVTPASLEKTVTSVANQYKVKDMKTVAVFSTEKTTAKDCTKASCANKTIAEKEACEKNCKKSCCASKV